MTNKEMVGSHLSIIDVGAKVNNTTALIDLNQAAQRLIEKLYSGYVTTLKKLVTAQALNATTGYFDLSTLASAIQNNEKGIIAVKITDGYFCNKISFEEYRQLQDAKFSFLSDDPRYYVIGTYIYPLPWAVGDTTTIDLYYWRKMTAITLSNTACELDTELHDIIVGLSVRKYARVSKVAAEAYTQALEDIEDKNSRYPQTDSWRNDAMKFPRQQYMLDGQPVNEL